MFSPVEINDLPIQIPIFNSVETVKEFISKFHESQESKRFFIKGSKVLKRLIEEYLPVSIYAQNKYKDENYHIRYCGHEGTICDALILNANGKVIEKIQITYAYDPNHHLHMEVLDKYGYFYFFEDPKVTGTQKNRKFSKPEDGSVSSQTIVNYYIKNILETYNKKNRDVEEYSNMTLLIGFQSCLLIDLEYMGIKSGLEISASYFKSVSCVNLRYEYVWDLF